jgi:hypothetical protein
MKQRRSVNFLKRPLAILVFLFLVAGGLFYWYEYRPSMIRKKCAAAAEKLSNKDEYIYEIVYRHCLRSCGIEYPAKKE